MCYLYFMQDTMVPTDTSRDAINRVSAFHGVLISYQSQIQFITDECGDAMNGDAMNRVSTSCKVQDR